MSEEIRARVNGEQGYWVRENEQTNDDGRTSALCSSLPKFMVPACGALFPLLVLVWQEMSRRTSSDGGGGRNACHSSAY
jgi:hypothetical protein